MWGGALRLDCVSRRATKHQEDKELHEASLDRTLPGLAITSEWHVLIVRLPHQSSDNTWHT